MQTMRRVYLYFIAAVSLTMLAVGLVNLLSLAFDQIFGAVGVGFVRADRGALREQVSLFTALVLPALPIWVLHWWLAERATRRPTPEADGERRSTVRALYLALVLAATLTAWAFAAGTLVYGPLVRLFGASLSRDLAEVPQALAIFLVTGGIWLYHWRVRAADLAGGQLAGAADWWPRLSLYYAAFFGAMRLLFGATDLIRLMNDLLLGGDAVTRIGAWWAQPLAGGLAQVAVGAAVWGGHWLVAGQRLERADWLGESEQQSILRRIYLYAVVLTGLFMTLWAFSASLEALLKTLLGATTVWAVGPWLKSIVEPPIGALPFTLFWFFHQRRLVSEAQRFAETPRLASVRRLSTYLAALAGLIYATVGLANVLRVLFELALGSSRTAVGGTPTWWRAEVSVAAAYALVGGAVWLWHWYAAQRRLAGEPAGERGALTRRLYLFTTVAAALVALLSSLALMLYRLLNVALGVDRVAELAWDLSVALGATAVALPVLVYHLLTLRHDLAMRAVTAATRTVTLVLTGPADADLDAQMRDLQAVLPPGYNLRRAGRAERGDAAPPETAPPTGALPAPAGG